VGALRFQSPRPRTPWSGVISATKGASSSPCCCAGTADRADAAAADPAGCIQACQEPPHVCPPTISEDCLYVNGEHARVPRSEEQQHAFR
jgi:carboxylesterase type B